MYSVYFSSPINSTTFTTCCDCAISEEQYCPRCGEEIQGYEEDKSAQEIRNNRFKLAFNKQSFRRG